MADIDVQPVAGRWERWTREYKESGDNLGIRVRKLRTVHLLIDSQAEFASYLWLSSRRTVETIESSKEAKTLSTDLLVRLNLFLLDPKFKRATGTKRALIREIVDEVSAELYERQSQLLAASVASTKETNENRRKAYYAKKLKPEEG